MQLTGGCRCGAVRYTVTGAPVHMALCHCHDCRRSSGAPVMAWAMVAEGNVAVTGTPVAYASSAHVTRSFCGGCGTGLFYTNPAMLPGMVDIQAATFDDTFDDFKAVAPTVRIQVAEALHWWDGFKDLPTFDRYPAPSA